MSVGVLLATCGIAFLAYFGNFITLWETIPLIAVLNGVWVIVLAAVSSSKQSKYELEPFVIGTWGAALLGGGLSWLLLAKVSYLAAIATFVIVLGVLAAAAGTRGITGKK
jgi:hypothetical protein